MSGGGPSIPPTPGFGWEPPTGPPMIGPPAAPQAPDAPGQPVMQPLPPVHPNQLPPPIGPPGAGTGRAQRVRPWWGMGDALMMVPIMALVLVVSFAAVAVLAVIEGVGLDGLSTADSASLPASMLVIPTLIQQGAWLGWPFVVSKWKGLGPAADWGWAFKPVDLAIGLGVAMIGMFLAAVAAAGISALVGLEDAAQAENTQIISDLEGSPWLFGLLFVVVIGAPLSEEILFRGLILRSVGKRWGSVAGVIGSLLFFVPIHIADGGVFSGGQLVLWVSIAALGAVLAVAAVMTGRLGSSIVAHVIINAIASAGALGYFDGLTDSLPT